MTKLNIMTSIPKKHLFTLAALMLLFTGSKVLAASDIVYVEAHDFSAYGTGAAVNGSTLGIQVNNFGGELPVSEPIRGVARKYNIAIKPTVTTLTVGENDSATKYVSVDPAVYQAGATKPTIYPYTNRASGRVAVY